jgi:hypothetical protein
MVTRILAGARAGAADLVFVRRVSPYPVVLSIVPVDERNSFFNVLDVFLNLANCGCTSLIKSCSAWESFSMRLVISCTSSNIAS